MFVHGLYYAPLVGLVKWCQSFLLVGIFPAGQPAGGDSANQFPHRGGTPQNGFGTPVFALHCVPHKQTQKLQESKNKIPLGRPHPLVPEHTPLDGT